MVLGAVLNPNGNRYVLYLYWNDGQLNWNYNWLDNENWNHNNQVLIPGHSSFKRLEPSTGHLADLYQRGCKLAGTAIIQSFYFPQKLNINL